MKIRVIIHLIPWPPTTGFVGELLPDVKTVGFRGCGYGVRVRGFNCT